MGKAIRVIVVDDHPLYRSGVVSTLKEFVDIQIVGEGASSSDAQTLVRDLSPDVALLDISMPGNGLRAAKEISSQTENKKISKIIMLTASEDEREVLAALEAGAVAYALKGIGGSDLVAIIRTVFAGGSYVAPTLAGRLLLNSKNRGETPEALTFSTLSARELEVARLLTMGLSNKEIAKSLGLQEKTIKHHMTQLLHKLRVRNRVEAAMLAKGHFERTAR